MRRLLDICDRVAVLAVAFGVGSLASSLVRAIITILT